MKKTKFHSVIAATAQRQSIPLSKLVQGTALLFLTLILFGVPLSSSGQCIIYEPIRYVYGNVEMDGQMFFAASDDVNRIELWKSDGTAAGTGIVKNINATTSNSGHSDLVNLTPFNGVLYFFAEDGIHGQELWKTDGTEAGTQMVIDLNVGPSDAVYVDNSYPDDPYPYLNILNGELLMFANDGITGTELWKTDGTAAGTVLVKDIFPGVNSNNRPNSSSPLYLAHFNGEVYFTARNSSFGYELWKTDGTTAGTVLVKEDLSTSRYILLASEAPIEYNGELYFEAHDGSNYGLWKTDGTTSGTTLVKDIDIRYLTLFNGKIYFDGNGAGNDNELWYSDGTTNGTQLLIDINPGGSGSYPANLIVFNNELLFSANDGIHGIELWKTDGTAGGTLLVKDLLLGTTYGNPSSGSPRGFSILNGEMVFAANSNDGDLWKTDGTGAGTVPLVDIIPGNANFGISSRSMINALDRLFFVATTSISPRVQSYFVFANKDSDHDGIDDACDDMFSVCDAIDFLDNEVSGLNLPNNTEGFLLDKLAQATTKYQQGNISAANGKLGAFINKINAKSPSEISPEVAAALIAITNTIMDAMTNGNTECSSGGQNFAAPNLDGVIATSSQKLGLELFPNPAQQEVTIHLSELGDTPARVLIYNHLGELVYENKTDEISLTVDISYRQYSNGIYTMTVEQAGITTSKRFVILK